MVLEPVTTALIVGAVTGVGSAAIGAAGAAQSNKQAKKAVKQQYKYDVEAHEMNIEKMEADYEYLVQSILSQEKNFDTQRAYKDQLSVDTYNRELQIANIERATNAAAFAKSEQIYGQTLGLNNLSASTLLMLLTFNVKRYSKLLPLTINNQLSIPSGLKALP